MRSGMCESYEDVFQEFSEQFVKAFQKFEPDRGLKFSTMYVNYCTNRMRRLNNYSKRDKRSGITHNFSEFSANDESFSFEQTIMSDYLIPEEKLEAFQEFNFNIGKASPAAQLVLSWLIDTPDFIEVEAKQFFGREEVDLSLRTIAVRTAARVIGLTPTEERALGREVAELIGEQR